MEGRAMKSGMEMMLDSMGIQTGAIKQLLDPANIKALLSKIETMCNSVEDIKASVLRIETKLGTLPESIAMQLLGDGQSEAFQETVEFVKEYNGGNSRDSDNGNGSDTGSINGDATSSGNGRGL
jgi:hypothetical protein